MGLLTDREKGLLNHDSIEEARKGKIVYIDLDEICMNPDNIGVISDEDIQIKYDSILEVGLLQPLLVKKTENGLLLNTGHKRFLALKKLSDEGRSYRYLGKELSGLAPCQYLYDEMDKDMFNLLAIVSNAHHPDSKEEKREKVWQLHKYYQQMVEQGRKPAGREREWITSMTGISDGTVKTLLAVFNAQKTNSEVVPGSDTSDEPISRSINKEVTMKLIKFNKYLLNVDLTVLSEMERKTLNELLLNVQDTLEALIYVHPE